MAETDSYSHVTVHLPMLMSAHSIKTMSCQINLFSRQSILSSIILLFDDCLMDGECNNLKQKMKTMNAMSDTQVGTQEIN